MAHEFIPDGDDESRTNGQRSRSLQWSEEATGGCVIGDRGETGILPRLAESVNCVVGSESVHDRATPHKRRARRIRRRCLQAAAESMAGRRRFGSPTGIA
jgi:hypothetical protein